MSSLPKPLGQPWSSIILPQKGFAFPESQTGKFFPAPITSHEIKRL